MFNIPVVADFSEVEDASAIGEVCDLIQIPAYLCRQTSILRAGAKTGKPIHLKKGQFMSPWNMKNSVRKTISCYALMKCNLDLEELEKNLDLSITMLSQI